MSEAVKLSIVPESPERQSGPSDRKMTVGERLASARLSQELSIDQIAGQLKWSARQISEIEAGNYSVFPDMLTLRGFVRTYAKTLKIDSVPLIEELTTEFEKLPARPIDRPKLDTPFPGGRMPWRQGSNPQKVISAILVVFLCVVAAFVYRVEIQHLVLGVFPEKLTRPAEIAEPVAAVGPAADVRQVQSNSSNSNNSPVSEVKTETGQLAANVVPQVNSGTPESIAVAPLANEKKSEIKAGDTNSARDNQTDQKKNPLATDGVLVLKFKQDSWIQIRRLDGSVVTSRLYKAGTEETIGVNEPMNMVIGNAPGVEVWLRGQSQVLPAQPGSNVVNLGIK